MQERETDSYSHVLKYTGIFGGVQGINIMVSLVRTKLVTWLLGPSGMGLVALFNTTVNFISQATNMGISFSAVKHVSELFDEGDEERIRHFVKVVRVWSLMTALLGMLVCIVAGPLLSSYTFSWGDHTLHFIVLSPAVGLTAIMGGETAILKGARQLKPLAAIQVLSIVVALLVSVPIYYVWGESGIVPVIVLMVLVPTLLTVRYSYRLYPLQLSGREGIWGEGMQMVRLGVAFISAGILGSGADFLIRSYLNNVDSLDVVGLYNVGFTMTMTYAGLIFSAMDTDYFPRLSGVNNDVRAYTDMINKQIEVALLLIAPILVMVMFSLPVAVPLLTSSKFLPVVDMMRVATLALYMRAVTLPIEYLSLAKGDALSYLFLEAFYDVAMVLLVIGGYQYAGLLGTGYALVVTGVLNVVLVLVYTRLRYRFSLSPVAVGYLVVQLGLGLLAYWLSCIWHGAAYWLAGGLLSALSLGYSVRILHRKAHLWRKLTQRVAGKFRRGRAAE